MDCVKKIQETISGFRLPPPLAWYAIPGDPPQILFPVYGSSGSVMPQVICVLMDTLRTPKDGRDFGRDGYRESGEARWFVLEFNPFVDCAQSVQEKVSAAVKRMLEP